MVKHAQSHVYEAQSKQAPKVCGWYRCQQVMSHQQVTPNPQVMSELLASASSADHGRAA